MSNPKLTQMGYGELLEHTEELERLLKVRREHCKRVHACHVSDDDLEPPKDEEE